MDMYNFSVQCKSEYSKGLLINAFVAKGFYIKDQSV